MLGEKKLRCWVELCGEESVSQGRWRGGLGLLGWGQTTAVIGLVLSLHETPNAGTQGDLAGARVTRT